MCWKSVPKKKPIASPASEENRFHLKNELWDGRGIDGHREVEQLLQVAARDLIAAEKILPDDLDWAFNIVYNAVL